MSRLEKCKICGADIAGSAKSCPSCGAKVKKPIFRKWWFWAIIVIVIILIAGGNSSDKSKKNNTNSSTEVNTDSEKERSYSIGETITTDTFEITITGVKTQKTVGSSFLSSTASDGGTYVCVDFEYKNISQKPISSFSCPDISLKDAAGTTYSSDISASSYYATETDPDRKTLSDLNPGIKVRDSDVFEISEETYNAGGFILHIDADKDFDITLN